MKTLEQKAKEYVRAFREAISSDSDAGDGAKLVDVCCKCTERAFMDGYAAASKWISVNDELPGDDRAILALNKFYSTTWTSNMNEDGEIAPYEIQYFGTIGATHWREIEIPE